MVLSILTFSIYLHKKVWYNNTKKKLIKTLLPAIHFVEALLSNKTETTGTSSEHSFGLQP